MTHKHEFNTITKIYNGCAEPGMLVRRCRHCQYFEIIGSVKPPGHEYITQTVTPADCSHEGKTKLLCQRCNKTITQTIPTIPHKYISHLLFHKCKNCGKIKPRRNIIIISSVFIMLIIICICVYGFITLSEPDLGTFNTEVDIYSTENKYAPTAAPSTTQTYTVETLPVSSEDNEAVTTEYQSTEKQDTEVLITEQQSTEFQITELQNTELQTTVPETTQIQTTCMETTALITTAPKSTTAETTVFETTAIKPTTIETATPETTTIETVALETTTIESITSEPTIEQTCFIQTTEINSVTENTTQETINETTSYISLPEEADYYAHTGFIYSGSEIITMVKDGYYCLIISNIGMKTFISPFNEELVAFAVNKNDSYTCKAQITEGAICLVFCQF